MSMSLTFTIHDASRVKHSSVPGDVWLLCIFDPQRYKHVPIETFECSSRDEAESIRNRNYPGATEKA